ncbi:MAG: hypothetical protein KDK66_08230 [Deltaproteobacteria bacterium]|nr:hypothetical protein [Deltaproteobacteria bacterium]
MSSKLQALTSSNFDFHLRKASSLLNSPIHREELHTLGPWKDFLYYLECTLGLCSYADINVYKKDDDFTLIDPVASTWPEEVIQSFFEHPPINNKEKLKPKLYQNLGQDLSTSELEALKKLGKNPSYYAFMRPYKLGNQLQILFSIDSNKLGSLSLYYPHKKPHKKSKWQTTVCHFITEISQDLSMALSHRHLLKETLAIRGSLDRLQLGIIFLNEQGFVALANTRAKEILSLRDPLFSHHGRLFATDTESHEKLYQLCDQLLKGESRQREQQLILKSASKKSPLQIMVVSLDNKLSESVLGGYVPIALFIHCPCLESTPSLNLTEIFQTFYGCGPKQAKVAELFSQGFSETQIAEKIGISKETVRTQLAQASLKLRDREFESLSRKKLFFEIAHQHQWPLRKNKELLRASYKKKKKKRPKT